MNYSLNKENSILFKNNLSLFRARFPELLKNLEQPAKAFETSVETESLFFSDFSFLQARNGQITAKENGVLLHSAYDPQREAERNITLPKDKEADVSAGVFYGTGLGYQLNAFAEKYPDKALVLVEPEPLYFFIAMACIDFSAFFHHRTLLVLLQADITQVLHFLEKLDLDSIYLYKNQAHISHSQNYFASLDSLIKRNIQKNATNRRTLEVFSTLWFRNMCRNINYIAECGGISSFESKAGSIPFCLIAAGPTLEEVLPHLAKIKKRCVILCVDTALRACLKAGVQPDFIFLTDPQFWNARHLDRLEAPDSILITESAAYPSVFRFKCRRILLCSSMFPLGKYIEKRTGSKGVLGTGGSVASTAWDFARFCGAKTIYTAGLDLGFPNGKTHIKGSTFEEKAFFTSDRTKPAETIISSALFSAKPLYAASYSHKTIRTDNRMSLYAWWFESKIKEFSSITTKSLSAESMAIPGVEYTATDEVLALPEIRSQKIETFINNGIKSLTAKTDSAIFDKTLSELKQTLEEMAANTENAVKLCARCLNYSETKDDYIECLNKLEKIDELILKSEATELASLLFPTKNLLEKEMNYIPVNERFQGENDFRKNVYRSKIIYTKTDEVLKRWLKGLF